MTDEKKIPEACGQCGRPIRLGRAPKDAPLNIGKDERVFRCAKGCAVYTLEGDHI